MPAVRAQRHQLHPRCANFLCMDTEGVDPARPLEEDPARWALYQRAHVVLLVLEKRVASLQRLRTHWLPEMAMYNVTVPVVVAINKTDLLPEPGLQEAGRDVSKVASLLGPATYCVECSAKHDLRSVGTLFGRLQTCALFPAAPLLEAPSSSARGTPEPADASATAAAAAPTAASAGAPSAGDASATAGDAEAPSLRDEAMRAYAGVFATLDADKDGVLNVRELQQLQFVCYGEVTSEGQVKGFLKQMHSTLPSGSVTTRGLTLQGFLLMMSLNVSLGHTDKAWLPLLTHGLDFTLHRRPDA